MKIEKNDTTDGASLAYALLTQISKEANYFRTKADRLDELNRTLIYYIHSNKITDTQQIEAAVSWEKHTNLPIQEIMNLVLRNDP